MPNSARAGLLEDTQTRVLYLHAIAVVQATLEPGGYTGWHGHPGPSIVIVKSGTLTLIEQHRDACVEHSFGPGKAFVHPEDRHNFVNKSATDDQDRMLTLLAESEGISKQEAVIRAIAERSARIAKDAEVRRLAREAIRDYGPLLDRLAQ
jgi:quercetin dioxygenase-like cupin family protein